MLVPRRTFLARLGVGAVALAGTFCTPATRGSRMAPLYIGTYTRGRSQGIYLARTDAANGRITLDRLVAEVENPSFLALNRGRTHLYAVSEVDDFAGTAAGGVLAYSIQADGGLRELNRQPSQGATPCHLTVDATGRFVLVANYTGGNAAVLPIQSDGSLGPATDVVQHTGSGPNAQRQEGPHAHSVTLDGANRFALVADLGIDRVVGYGFDVEQGALIPSDLAGIRARPGAGPRHFAFHPDGRRAYVINELDSTLTALAYDPATGSLESTGTVSTLPEGYAGDNSCADVHVHPSGRFVYGSNRGHDSIAVFAINDGALTSVQHQSTLGRVPRNFAIAPSGRFLIAANQDTDSLVTFSVDSATGQLAPVGAPVEVPVPVCVRFA
jgi:6-phosphogluconolactonase